MKVAVQKNHLEGQISDESPNPIKNGVILFLANIFDFLSKF